MKEKLIKEAIERGFVAGAVIKGEYYPLGATILEEVNYDYWGHRDILWVDVAGKTRKGSEIIYENGEWVGEILERAMAASGDEHGSTIFVDRPERTDLIQLMKNTEYQLIQKQKEEKLKEESQLLDHFAGLTLQGLVAIEAPLFYNPSTTVGRENLAELSYKVAENMLKVRQEFQDRLKNAGH